MDISTITQSIGSVGFPIVACGALYYWIRTEMTEMRKCIQNNTTALIKLLEHLNCSNSSQLDGD